MKPRDLCQHEVVHIWTKVHDRATMDKRVGSTGKTYNMVGWSCVFCGLHFFPGETKPPVSSQLPIDIEIHGERK